MRASTLCLAALLVLCAYTTPTYARSVQASPAYQFVDSVGVCTHFWNKSVYDTRYAEVKAALADLGIKHIRTDIVRSKISPDHARLYGYITDLWKTHRVKSTLLVDARVGTSRRLEPRAIGALLNDVRSHLGAQPIDALEGPNEVDMLEQTEGYAGWADDLKDYQSRLYEQAKADSVLRDKPVLAPSLAFEQSSPTKMGDLSAITDLGNGHEYANRRTFSAVLDLHLPQLRKVNPHDPIWITEYGWHTAANSGAQYVSEAVQAKDLVRGMAEIAARPEFARGYMYQLVDSIADPERKVPAGWFGLLDINLKRKHAYHAVRNMMHTLCDTPLTFAAQALDFDLQGDLRDVHTLLLQKNNRAFYLVLWLEQQSYNKNGEIAVTPRSLRLIFKQPAGRVRTYLPAHPSSSGVSGREPVNIFFAPNSIDLSVPDHVLIVEVFPRGGTITPIRRSCDFDPS
jgi:hypothetical protein